MFARRFEAASAVRSAAAMATASSTRKVVRSVVRSCAAAILSALALLVGCQRNDREAAPSHATAAAALPAELSKPGDRVDVNGIVVEHEDNGLIKLTGQDRWGKPLAQTFENIEFLRKALPVLEQSVTAEQAAGLRALVSVR